ncbi:phosphoadenosine phosphosulfate reductase domain-containing protein, partial [Streptomyces scabiei]|uniref:phosphoadenosine phosphosulfate reductase domain-containing protein n=1 Tax=Streptomyces scabiei TaxID=1930 RepID=UPI0038F67753
LADTLALLQEIEQRHAPAALSNGFGPESMILTDLIARHNLAIDIFSLDTGRLPPETYHLAQSARRRYGLTIHLFTPKPEELE